MESQSINLIKGLTGFEKENPQNGFFYIRKRGLKGQEGQKKHLTKKQIFFLLLRSDSLRK